MDSKFHALMFPWFAFGHMTPFLHLANELAQRGHKVTFLVPKKAQIQLQHLNLHPDYIVFHTVTVPSVEGLPAGVETALDIPLSMSDLLLTAMDLTRDQFEAVIRSVKPNLIFYDFAHWVPDVAEEFGIKTVCYIVVSAASVAISLVPARGISKDKPVTVEELAVPPPGYPSSKVTLRRNEAHAMLFLSFPFGQGTTFFERSTLAFQKCDVISIRTYKEVEGKYCDYIESQYKKKVLLTGPMLPQPDTTKQLEDQWSKWLSGFESGSVVFCAFGSQITLEKDQFQELCLGFELSGSPFLVAVRPPMGTSTIQEALPDGFEERVKGRGVVWGGWVQQPLILSHPSVGCFVSHCGFGSMWESLMSDSQIVLLPHLGDQILNTRFMTEELNVAVEVKKEEETGWVSKESLRNAIKSVMDKDSEIGKLVKKNHVKWKETLSNPELMSSYMDKYVKTLQELVDQTNQN